MEQREEVIIKEVKEEKKKSALDLKLAELNKKFGKGSIISGKDTLEALDVISSGSLTLDIASSIGGIPRGKLIESFGPESSGKSTLTLHIIAEFQKKGIKCVLCDSEQSFDRKYATALGVDVDNLIIIQPECMEDGYNMIQGLIETKEVGFIVIDSHTSLMPKAVVDGDVGSATIGLSARINSVALGKIKPLLKPNNCTLLAISQQRTNIGGYGDPNISTGGLAYKFYSDMRFKVSKVLDKANELNKTVVEVIKNKCGVPFGKAEFAINWGTGIDRLQEVIDLAVEFGIIVKAGAGWQTMEDGTKLQGDIKVKEYLADNPEYTTNLEKRVIELIKNQ